METHLIAIASANIGTNKIINAIDDANRNGTAEAYIYDKFVLWAGGGALVPITSFGHLLIHGAMDTVNNFGVMGLFMGMFDLTSSGIVAAIVFSFVLSLIFQPRD